jgi:hypothetical protein
VLSGADLLCRRREREQWRQLAEGATDDATADCLHRSFEPTARAIDGLEKALAGLGLRYEALGRRAGVSRTFLYSNPEARSAVAAAIADADERRGQALTDLDDQHQATRRERALNADNRTLEECLTAARSTLRFQDRRIADLEAQLTEPEGGR